MWLGPVSRVQATRNETAAAWYTCGMVDVRRAQAGNKRDVATVYRTRHSRRPGDRVVTWLIVGFVCIAAAIMGFAIARSRSEPAPPRKIDDSNKDASYQTGHDFRVVRILDGDTLIIIGQDNIELTLRLAGIDAPEKDQLFGLEASRFLDSLLSTHAIHLDNMEREKFGRILADIYIGSRWINLEMVQNGWAWAYPNSTSRLLQWAEAEARKKKIGLWESASPRPPWKWRAECP